MRFALSTNWNNTRLSDGAAIADEALELGFDALELGFRTQPEQLAGFKSRLGAMPVDSVHAYCPVPIGAPSGHPELHQLAAKDEDERALARLLMRKTLACAAELGAKVVVTHAGYVDLDGFFVNCGSDVLRRLLKSPDGKFDPARPVYARHLKKAKARRRTRGLKLLEVFRRELDLLLPEFEKAGVTLALENLPRLEGFPNAEEGEVLTFLDSMMNYLPDQPYFERFSHTAAQELNAMQVLGQVQHTNPDLLLDCTVFDAAEEQISNWITTRLLEENAEQDPALVPADRLQQMLGFACAAGALTTTGHGAIPSLHGRQDIMALCG